MKVDGAEIARLRDYLLAQSRACRRPPVDRFRHPWLSPMPPSPAAQAQLDERRGQGSAAPYQHALATPASGDGFTVGDYSLGLFHHDASEASIELLRHEDLKDACAGSLLCLLDCAHPSGRVHRAELAHKSREAEPSKPVIAQYAWRVVQAMGPQGAEWCDRHRVLDRVLAFLRYLERAYVGLHGLFLTHSALQTGFDSDVLSAGAPDKTVEGPDTNAFMCLEYEAAARLAGALGRAALADELEQRRAALADAMERLLWYEDERGGGYSALRWQHGVGSLEAERVGERGPDGRHRPFQSWITLLPLYAGIPSPARAEKLVQRLLRPEGYWGPVGVRTAPADDRYFHQAPRILQFDFKKKGRGPVSNWSGPVWILSNYYLAKGLARYGGEEPARELALKTARLLIDDLAATGVLHECYDDRGRGLWPQTGTFLSWNVLALTLLREHAPVAGVAV